MHLSNHFMGSLRYSLTGEKESFVSTLFSWKQYYFQLKLNLFFDIYEWARLWHTDFDLRSERRGVRWLVFAGLFFTNVRPRPLCSRITSAHGYQWHTRASSGHARAVRPNWGRNTFALWLTRSPIQRKHAHTQNPIPSSKSTRGVRNKLVVSPCVCVCVPDFIVNSVVHQR